MNTITIEPVIHPVPTAEEQKKHRQTFIEALRSGEYTQTMFQSQFYDPELDIMCYCASGLAMHLMQVAGARYRLTSNDYYGMTFSEWGDVIHMNDRGNSFPVIADWLEANTL